MTLHGSAVALDGEGVLLLAPPGSGKSDLVLRLLESGWRLVADDQVALRRMGSALLAAPPPSLAGMLELRGLGLVSGLAWAEAPLHLVARLMPEEAIPRLPTPETWEAEGVRLPLVALDGRAASAPARLRAALDVARGRLGMVAGALAA
uniref:HPr kinase/phosphorylase n=1 Tax=Sabulicella rubraurantiaca TaxID=2811429 RepID=UPI001A95EE7E|nr:HPr kinase/phosphatase C-terminal domain-containing protein [Sabulicella rubraurantiaca]